MIQELFSWLDAQRITYIPVDTEVVDIPGFGRLFTADLSGTCTGSMLVQHMAGSGVAQDVAVPTCREWNPSSAATGTSSCST